MAVLEPSSHTCIANRLRQGWRESSLTTRLAVERSELALPLGTGPGAQGQLGKAVNPSAPGTHGRTRTHVRRLVVTQKPTGKRACMV